MEAPDRVLIEQTYPGPEDDKNHFNYLLRAFQDKRYIKVDDKPMFLVYCPRDLPDPKRTTDYWREMAVHSGLKGLYLVGIEYEPWKHEDYGYDAQVATRLISGLGASNGTRKIGKKLRKLLGFPRAHIFLQENIQLSFDSRRGTRTHSSLRFSKLG